MIELSIVLAIIGLIVGGVLVGRDLIEAAQTRALVAQLEKYKTAVNAFRLKYGSLPGDIAANMAAGFGFAARAGGESHGDDNGVINSCNANHNQAYLGCENVLFWRDLSDAQMIDGSFTTATDSALPQIDTSQAPRLMPHYFPHAKSINNGYIVAFGLENTISPTHDPAGNDFLITGIGGTNASGRVVLGDAVKETVLSPQMAFGIDRKMDDGLALTGAVKGWTLAQTPGTCNIGVLQSFFTIEDNTLDPATADYNCLNVVMAGFNCSISQTTYDMTPNKRSKPLCILGTRF